MTNKTKYVEKELIDKVTLWMLRIIINIAGEEELWMRDGRLRPDSSCYFLDIDKEKYSKSDVSKILKTNLTKLEKRKNFTSSKILTKNINRIAGLMKLNSYESQLLEFVVLINQIDVLEDCACLVGFNLSTAQVKRILSEILNIPIKSMNEILHPSSKLCKSSIVNIDKNDSNSLKSKITIISQSFTDNMLNIDGDVSDILTGLVTMPDKSSLTLNDYEHISVDVNILLSYLKNAIQTKQKGVNILLYGRPGTGKSELSKVIAKSLNLKLFEISYADESDNPLDGKIRLEAYKIAQAFFANQNTMLLYDEAEDIFDSNNSPFAPKRQSNKAWINKVLETNTIPTIWITNNVNAIDNALIRRFDISLELPIPKKSKRAKIIKKCSNNLLHEQDISLLAENENITPALITRATKIANSINSDDKAKDFKQVLNNTLKAQGYKEIHPTMQNHLPDNYNPSFINTKANLEELVKGIQEHQNARLCLYGVPGTGKSAFGRYIAQTLDKPCILKKGSDLISKWVGGTEKNIADAFEEAKEEKAVLIFDEVDSFLTDRSTAQRSWEVTQTNEMLVQMENFDGIFIATTNLLENLDSASLRRFDLKLEFEYLKSEQVWEIFLSYCKELKLDKPTQTLKQKVENINYLTHGDFAAILRQNRFRPINNSHELFFRLEDEIKVKRVNSNGVVGFR